MDIFKLYRNFWDYAFLNPTKIKPNDIAIYSFAIEHCNRLGWKKHFGFPTTMVMEAVGIKSYSVYKKHFDNLIECGFFDIIEYSKNQYSANIIALKENNKANDKALDKAFIKHASKQVQSTVQSNDSIDKQINQLTNNNSELFFEEEKQMKDLIDLGKDPVITYSIKLYKGFLKHVPNKDLETVKVKDWVKPLRELFDKKEYTIEQVEEIANYILNNKFWKRIVIDSKGLVKQFEGAKIQYIEDQKQKS